MLSVAKYGVRTILLVVVICSMLMASSAGSVQAQDAPRLLIPSIEVDAQLTPVYIRRFATGEVTWDVSSLRHTVGIFDRLTPIGTRGNAVLGGHSEQARGVADVFFNLHQVQVGDEVLVTSGGDTLRYQVISVSSVNFRDLSILQDAGDERLTIITCDRSSYAGSGYANRVVVVAHRVG